MPIGTKDLDDWTRQLGDVLEGEYLMLVEGTEEESFSSGLLEHPQYTRPATWEGRDIPEILLSGNHARIDQWRRDQAEALTRARRPDLWAAFEATHPKRRG